MVLDKSTQNKQRKVVESESIIYCLKKVKDPSSPVMCFTTLLRIREVKLQF
ncbi:hypothetical protein HORM4_750015 [Vibrio harveyi]|nr:hypothetical protein VCHENC01_3935 [Vibrio harveyi]CAK6715971.1 hypothetical protein HORM4_750015 [Vibrio harveyi]